MLRGQGFAKPQSKSLFGALVVIVLVIFGSQLSAVIGHVPASSTLIMIIIAEYMESIWTTKAKQENSLVLSLFWRLMIGLIVPFPVIESRCSVKGGRRGQDEPVLVGQAGKIHAGPREQDVRVEKDAHGGFMPAATAARRT